MRRRPPGPVLAARSRRLVLAALTVPLLSAALSLGVILPNNAVAASPGDTSPVRDQLSALGTVVGVGTNLPPLPTGIDASSWLVADVDTGDILAARAAHSHWLPASTLKVLTALALVHRIPAQTPIPVTFADINVDGTRVGLVPGKTYSADSLFTGLLIASGNDAAGVLADAAGGVDTTLRYMAEEASLLHANDTVAGTPSGLDAPGEHTSAYDLALLGRAALADPLVAKYLTIRTATVSAPGVAAFQIANHNPLLGRYEGTVGVKAGYTVAAQATYIGAASRGGHRILVTLMHAYPHFKPFAESLLNWGFAVDGHIQPVGRLADPGPNASGTPDPLASPGVGSLARADAIRGLRDRAAAVSHPAGTGFFGWLLRLVIALLFLVAVLRLRVRHRRRRYRTRLKLPRV